MVGGLGWSLVSSGRLVREARRGLGGRGRDIWFVSLRLIGVRAQSKQMWGVWSIFALKHRCLSAGLARTTHAPNSPPSLRRQTRNFLLPLVWLKSHVVDIVSPKKMFDDELDTCACARLLDDPISSRMSSHVRAH